MRVLRSTSKRNEFVDLVLNGDAIVERPLRLLISKSLAKGTFYEDLKGVTNDQERVNLVASIFPYSRFRKILKSLDKVLVKNEAVMNILEARGDAFHMDNDIKMALHCYALALSFAPNGTPDITKIYMKRSAMFVSLEKYDLACLDVEMAISHERQRKSLTYELFEKEKALRDLIVPELKGHEDLLREEYKEKIISRVLGESPGAITALPEFISVNHEEYRKRFLVTNVDLEPGTTVLVEEPFVCATYNQLKWQTKYCDRCLKETLNPIPCKKCVFLSYCSAKCRSEDKMNGHKYECPLLPFTHSVKMPKCFNLSLKAITKVGPDVLQNLYDKSRCGRKEEDAWFVPLGDTHGNSDTYSQVLNLATRNLFHDMPFSAWLAISLSYGLRIKTSFFDYIPESQKLGFENFVASIILHHFESFTYNTVTLGSTGIEIRDIRAHFENTEGKPVPDVGFGVYPLASLMNHSCAPTTFCEYLAGGKIAIITNRKLKAGEELSHSYGPDFLKDPIKKRNRECWEGYDFFCSCVACNEKWPMLTDMDSSKLFEFACPDCKTCITNVPGETPSVIKVIGNNSEKFKNCDVNLETFKKFEEILGQANEHVLENKPLQAIPLLIRCIEYFQNNDGPPSMEMILSQARLKDSYDLLVNTVNLTKTIDLIEPEEEIVEQKEVKVEVPINRRKVCAIV